MDFKLVSSYKPCGDQPQAIESLAEGLENGGKGVALSLVPGIEIPNMLSILATHDANGYVPGINNILEGFVDLCVHFKSQTLGNITVCSRKSGCIEDSGCEFNKSASVLELQEVAGINNAFVIVWGDDDLSVDFCFACKK